MINKDFEMFTKLENTEFPFCNKYSYEDCIFYVEPMFMSQLEGFKTLRKEEFPKLWEGFLNTIKENKKVIFTHDFEMPIIPDLEGFIYREITDISDPLHIFVEDKSRGSDYGD